MAAARGFAFGADFPQQPPRPPEDVELKNIIDKLANFVARNGPEFEQMTMTKQRDNAKFHFLFGGEWHAYYKWCVMSEHQGQQGGYQPPLGGFPGSQIPPLMSNLRPLMSVGTFSRPPPNVPPFPPPLFGGPRGFGPGFIPNMPPPLLLPSAPVSSQSQPQSLMSQGLPASQPNTPWPQHQTPSTTSQASPTGPTHSLQLIRQELQTELETYGITDPLEMEFGTIVKRLMDSCTKDSIASGKSWIFSHADLPDECAKVAKFILRKTLDGTGVGFSEKLHIIYLVNDVIHHCVRKGAQDLLQALEDLIVQIFFNVHSSNSDNSDSLRKVSKIWESQKYFSDSILQQIQAILAEATGKQTEQESCEEDKQKQQSRPWEQSPAQTQLQQSHPWEQRDQQSQQSQLPWQQQPQQDQQNQKSQPPWQQQPQQDQQSQPPWQQQPQQDQQNPKSQPPWQQQPQQDQQSQPPWQQQPQQDKSEQLSQPPWQQQPQQDKSIQQSQPPWQQQPQQDQPPQPPWQQQPQQDQQNQQVVPPWQQNQQDQQNNQQSVPPWQQDKPLLPWQQSQSHPWEKQQEPNKPPFLPWEQQHAPPPWPPLHPDGPPPLPWAGPPGGLPPWQQGPPPVGEPTPLFPTKPVDPPPTSLPPSHPPALPSSQDSVQEEGKEDNIPPQDTEDAAGSPRKEGSPDPNRCPPPPLDEDLGRGEREEGGHGVMQSFDYQHGHPFRRGFDDDFRDEGPPPREVFDYNHRPPHWDMHPPPHLPPMGPGGPFDPWGPPPPHLPPPLDLPPPIPYYDLPAGLMVALVPLFEHGYRPLDPLDVVLPPPQPPSERLLKAVEEFYKSPSEDTPRNEEGWEARALLDFYEAKNRAKSNRYRPMRRPLPRRPRSRSRSYSRSPPPRRRRSNSHSHSRSRSRSRSRPPRSQSHSRSPQRRSYSNERSRSRSRSQSRSHSHSPHRSRQRRSRSRSPFIPIAEDRRLPPQQVATTDTKIAGSNVGHQLLKKMGWEEGAGLGLREQGIQEPIQGGEVRDKNDKYKGVGVDMRDPFEQFRKNKSYTFNRSRAPPSPP